MSAPDFPKRLLEKLRALRKRTQLSPDELAPHVKASDGRAIESSESGEGGSSGVGPVRLREAVRNFR
jgi:hypothetical protein